MCAICKKFKKGSITAEEARDELDEQMEYLSEEHIEEMEEMLAEAEDTYDYILENKLSKVGFVDQDDDYSLEEDLQEEESWEDEDE